MLSSEVQGKVVEAFEVFDHENNKTVDVREVSLVFFTNHQATKSSSVCKENISKVGTIVRSLGHCPSESQLQEVKYISYCSYFI